MNTGLMQPGPTLYEAEQRRKKAGSQGLLGELGTPMSYSPNPLVHALGSGLLSMQYLTGEKDLNEGMSALGLMSALSQGMKVPPMVRNAIRVYHGSPHKYEKADSSKIGTGEGAQAYGHGLYWAENPGVAKGYADKLGKPGKAWQTAQDITDSLAKGDVDRIAFLEKKGTWAPEEFKAMKKIASDPEYLRLSGKERQQKFWSLWDKEAKQSNLYEASLRWPDAAREARDPLSAKHFLDWDKPLDAQSETVKRAIYDNFGGKGRYVTGAMGERRHVRPVEYDKTGEGLYKGIKELIGKGDAATSEALRAAGIPGITYLDAGSRAAGQGTRNYVTFDDALVELLKRNGMPIGGLLGK